MTIQVTGTLVDPTGQPLANAVIRIISLDTTQVIASSLAKVSAGVDGTYNFSLLNGKYSLEILQTNKYSKVAYIEVTALTVTPITLEELITDYAFCEVEAPTCPE